MHDSSNSSQGWLPAWPPDSSFRERYKSSYRSACAWSESITKDFRASQEAVNDAFTVLNEHMEMSPIQFKAILRNKSIDALRKQIRRRKVDEFDSTNGADNTPPQPDQVSELQDAEALTQAIRGYLKELERAIFDCKREELSDKETASQLGTTEEAVKQRWKRIKSKLRNPFRANYKALQS